MRREETNRKAPQKKLQSLSKQAARKERSIGGEAEDNFDIDLPDLDPDAQARAKPEAKKRKRRRFTEPEPLSAALQNAEADCSGPPKSKKSRKAAKAKAEDDIAQPLLEAERAAGKAEKRAGKKQKLKIKSSATEFDSKKAISSKIVAASLEKQADWLWESFVHSTGASSLERNGLNEEDLIRIGPHGSFEERIKQCQGNLAARDLGSENVDHGSPTIIVVAASAVIANNLGKELRGLSKACRVAKLFAKHFKPEEQQRDLKRLVQIATGTPNRMVKLADLGSLKFTRLQLLVLDVARDAKQRTILDIPEVRKDFWQLFSKHVKQPVANGRAKIALTDSAKLL